MKDWKREAEEEIIMKKEKEEQGKRIWRKGLWEKTDQNPLKLQENGLSCFLTTKQTKQPEQKHPPPKKKTTPPPNKKTTKHRSQRLDVVKNVFLVFSNSTLKTPQKARENTIKYASQLTF